MEVSMEQKSVKEMMNEMNVLETDYEKQHRYVEELKKKGPASFSLIAADAFVEGMRDSGYKSTGTAIDEFIDNSIQAQAERIDVIYTQDSQKSKKRDVSVVKDIAIIDDGHGMEPDMIRAAVLWGGTHRAGDRSGFGRYGFGLPSAAVSITRHYEVYSRTDGFGWHRVSIDLHEIISGKHTKNGIVMAPEAEPCELPIFVNEYLAKNKRELKHGTVILLTSPDRLTSGYRRPTGFQKKVLEHLGLIYRDSIRRCSLYVNGEKVQAVDPLFLDPNARFYDVENGVFAQERDPLFFEVNTEKGKTGVVRMRFSYLPFDGFQRSVKDGKMFLNERFSIMKDNNAFFIVSRAGRQIDLITRVQFPSKGETEGTATTLLNYDRNWAIELDFDPVLDEEFGITVNKQQITLSERMWQILKEQGLPSIIKSLRAAVKSDKRAKIEKEDSAEESIRTAEQIMAESEKFIRKPTKISPEKEERAKQKVLDEAEKQAKETGKDKGHHVREIIEQIQKRTYRTMLEAREGAPFFRMDQFGAQKRLIINTAHPFFTEVYSGPDSTPRLKASIELLLFAIGSCELDANGDQELFYQEERMEWSKRLRIYLKLLDRIDPSSEAFEANDELPEELTQGVEAET